MGHHPQVPVELHKLEDSIRMIISTNNSVSCVQLAAVVANNEVKSRRNQAKLIFQYSYLLQYLKYSFLKLF